MYRNYQEEACYMRSSRQRAMASRSREAQAIALALPQTRRNGFTLFAPTSLALSLITSLSLIIISLIILVSLVLILLGL
jgi:hypothetical protein